MTVELTPALRAQINACSDALRDEILRVCDNAEAPSAPGLDEVHSIGATQLAALTEVLATLLARGPKPQARWEFFKGVTEKMLALKLLEAWAKHKESPNAD